MLTPKSFAASRVEYLTVMGYTYLTFRDACQRNAGFLGVLFGFFFKGAFDLAHSANARRSASGFFRPPSNSTIAARSSTVQRSASGISERQLCPGFAAILA